MGTFQHLMTGFATALSPMNLLFATIGCILGTLIGVLPGLGPAAGTALLIPITFKLDPTAAIVGMGTPSSNAAWVVHRPVPFCSAWSWIISTKGLLVLSSIYVKMFAVISMR